MNTAPSTNAGTIQILINLAANQQIAQQTAASLKQAADGIDKVTKSALSLKTAGRDLREVGGYIAAAGVGILAPFIAAANQYEQKYARLEPIANAYAVAQKKQADATIQLGRAGAQALTPFLNQVADVEKKIADFATAHPDIVQAVVGGGAVLVTVGGAMAAVGQVLVTVANAAKLLGVQAAGVKTLFGNMATAAGSVGLAFAALQVAVPVTIAGINAFGKAINDPRLAHITLGDVLNTGSQAIQIALAGLAQVFIGVESAIKIVIADIQHIGDPNWNKQQPVALTKDAIKDVLTQATAGTNLAATRNTTSGIVPIGSASPGYRPVPSAGIIPMGGGNTGLPQGFVGGTVSYEAIVGHPPSPGTLQPGQQGPIQSPSDAALNMLISQLPAADRASIHTMDDLTNYYYSHQDVLRQNRLVPVSQDKLAPSARDQYLSQVTNEGNAQYNTALGIISGKGTGGGGGSGGGGNTGTDTTADTANAYIQLQKANAQADIQLAQQKLAAQTSYNQESLKLEKDREAQISVMLADQNRARLRAVADFNQNELMTEQKIQFQRQQQLYTMGLQANELAIQGDVAGFISAQIQNRNTILEQDKQNAFDKQQRKEQFDFQQAQQAEADKVALQQQKAQFAREDADRKTAYDDQLKQLEVSNANTKAENLRAFTEQIAQITGSNSAVALIYQNWYLQQEKAAQDFVDKQTATLAKLYGQTLGITVPDVNKPPPPNQQGAPIQTFAKGGYLSRGWNMVGELGPEMIHGASGLVVPNRGGGGGGRNISFNFGGISIGAGVSESVVKANLERLAEKLVNHMDTQMTLNYGATQ